jgi:alpha-L-rhamnosidase
MFVIPDAIYRECGDDSLFDGIMENNLLYLDYAALYEKEGGLVKFGLGDWCPPKHVEGLKLASNELSDSCYSYTNLRITAEALQRRCDVRAEKISQRADRLYKAILKKYLKDGIVDNDSVSAMAIFLYHLPIEEDVGRRIVSRMVEKIETQGYRICGGILGVKAMFEVLDKYGYSETAYKIMLCNEYPSFGVWQNEGLLTLPESLDMDAVPGLASLNHHMYSSPANWIYRRVGGIRNEGVAYDVCSIEPYIFADNASATCFTETPRGNISVKWSFLDGEFSADIDIPEGTRATLSVLGVEKILDVGNNKVNFKV